MNFTSRIIAHVKTVVLMSAVLLLGVLIPSQRADAYDYLSYEVTDFSVATTDTSSGASDTLTVTFTMPTAMTTAGYISLSSPLLYGYVDSVYTSESVNMANAVITSNELTVSYQSETSVSFYPTADLAAGATVSVTLVGVENPANVEASGAFSLYGSESGVDSYIYFSASDTVTYGQIDFTALLTDADGTTPIADVYVYVNYYGADGTYEYFSGTTDSEGQAYFSGLTTNRTYSVSFSYYGAATTNSVPSATTLTYDGTAMGPVEYSFTAPNVVTHFEDENGDPVSGSYWYWYDANWSNWVSGTTDSDGKISGFAADGTYTLYVAQSATNYNYFSYTFTVSSGIESGLADPISIPPSEVSGTVTAGGVVASNVCLSIYNTNWTVYRYSCTDASGNFSFALGVTDTYTLYVGNYGLPEGYFAPESQQISVTAGVAITPLSLELVTAAKTISGTVSNGGTAVTDAYIYAYNTSNWAWAYANTDSTGAFSFSVTGGGWSLYLYPTTYPSTWSYTGGSVYVEFANDSTVETETLAIEVEGYTSNITGTIVYPETGLPVGEYAVYLYASGGENNSVYTYGYTDANGQFTMPVTEGTFTVYGYFSDWGSGYTFPSIDPLEVAENETVDLGTITLKARNSRITGTVSTSNTGGVGNIYLYAYENSTWAWASGTTSNDGSYQLQVTDGEWQVCISSWGLTDDLGRSLVYTGGCQVVSVGDGETVGDINFLLQVADSTLSFTAKDNSGNALSNEYGWVSVYDPNAEGGWWSLGCYVYSGSCTVDVPSETAYAVSYYSYSGYYYTADTTTYSYSGMKIDGVAASSVTTEIAETKDVTLEMLENDVTVTGQFLDQESNPVDVYGYVYASSENGGWTYAYVAGTSDYTLKLSAGTWNVSYWTYDNYMSYGNTSQTITPAADETVSLNLYVLNADATISGTLLDADGNAVQGGYVQASTSYGENTSDTEDLYGHIELYVYSDVDGNFSMNVPSGTYYVSASSPTYYIDPQTVTVTADTAGSATGLTLQFGNSDATISGTIVDGYGITVNNRRTLAEGDGVANAYVSSYSLYGYSYTTTTDENGNFEIPAVIGDTVYITAVQQIGQNSYYSEQSEVVVDSATETVSVLLTQFLELPEAQTAQFDPQNAAVMTLEDGTELSLPANSITSENIDQVTVVLEPTLELAQEPEDKTLSYGIEVSVTDDNNAPVTELAGTATLTLPYDEANLEAAGVTEEELDMSYYDEAGGTWVDVPSTVVDTENNTYTVSVDHFSAFSITSVGSIIAADDNSNDGGQDNDDNSTPDGVLEAPTGFAVDTQFAKAITLSWNEEGDATSYQIKVINRKSGKLVKTVTTDKLTKKIKKLKANKKYSFKIRSIGSTGSQSEFSDLLNTRTLPTPPIGLKASQLTAETAKLRWSKPVGVISSYVVNVYTKNGDLVQKYIVKKHQLTVEGLDANTPYYFTVKARFNKNNTSHVSKKRAFRTSAS
ncbi:MAG: fibronectin type III domain-containing protein [Candidatus Kerfeldbacteria bacterium]|nr:fibronectin type III domain-containing protein [Candidatus Kerfeldbacteria bacterium]